MYARLLSILFRPETLDDVSRHFRSVSVPLITGHPGFAGVLGTVNHATGRTYLLTLWDSEAFRDASAIHPEFMQDMASYGAWMAGGFNRDSLTLLGDTLHEHLPADPETFASTRFTFVAVDPVHWETVVAAFQPLLHADAYPESGFQGALLLGDQGSGRLILIDLWPTRAQMVNTDGVLFNIIHQLRQSALLDVIPTHEVVDAVIRR